MSLEKKIVFQIFYVYIKILEFSLRHSLATIIVTVAITILMIFLAANLQVNANLEALLPENEKLNALIEKYDPGNQERNYFLMALDTKGDLSMEALQVYEQVVNELDELTGSYSSSIFNAITFKKKGGRLAPRLAFT